MSRLNAYFKNHYFVEINDCAVTEGHCEIVKEKILIFYRTGAIGDNIILIPIVNWLIKKHEGAEFVYFCNTISNQQDNAAIELLKNKPSISHFITRVVTKNKLLSFIQELYYAIILCLGDFSRVYYLVRNDPDWTLRLNRDFSILRFIDRKKN
jgi:hypothetical protein